MEYFVIIVKPDHSLTKSDAGRQQQTAERIARENAKKQHDDRIYLIREGADGMQEYVNQDGVSTICAVPWTHDGRPTGAIMV